MMHTKVKINESPAKVVIAMVGGLLIFHKAREKSVVGIATVNKEIRDCLK